jgi:hypothetical protein
VSPNLRPIKCYKCGYEWHVNLDELDEEDTVLYRNERSGTVTYQVKCRNCHALNVFEHQPRREP